MHQIKAYIKAIGGYVPETILSNTDLENTINTTADWIVERTGIEERRIETNPDIATSDLASFAIRDLLLTYKIDPASIDCLLLATSTPDYGLAPASSLVCKKSNLLNAWGIDLNGACSGFLQALTLGESLITSQRYQNVLVVGADKMSSIVNYNNRNTSILFGDGAGAFLLSATTLDKGIVDFLNTTDGTGTEHLLIPAGGSKNKITKELIDNEQQFIHQNGKVVFKNAIESMSKITKELIQRNQLQKESIDWVVPHQANLRIIKALSNELEIPLDQFKINIQKYGNTTAATIPLCLWDYKTDFKTGSNIIFTAFGAGFNCSSIYIKW